MRKPCWTYYSNMTVYSYEKIQCMLTQPPCKFHKNISIFQSQSYLNFLTVISLAKLKNQFWKTVKTVRICYKQFCILNMFQYNVIFPIWTTPVV